ncbi:hypothetical protein Zmor_003697 [Zophobas morio]|uniref:C2H2-type domain-containing protein n=1 Tax=Zophobas morio TaxID=2755281 RepID=A0AA38HMN7_9CUCU|nr:hypothetical protein Zmor_003697 [Zophobas morio]
MSTLEYSESLREWGRSSWKNVHNCKLCPYFTTSLFLMVNHVRRHRSSQEKYTCENAKIEEYYCKDCDFRTELTILFRQHINKYHSFKIESGDDLSLQDFSVQKYVCKKCDLETNLSLKWLQHTSECMEKKENQTSVSFVKENTNIFHFKKGDGKRWYYCTKCSYKVRNKAKLKYHMAKHDVNKQYSCDKCPFKTGYKATLRDHIKRNHLDERDVEWHKCEKCRFKTLRKSDLIRHVNNLHLKEEEGEWYECNECPYKTRSKCSLKTHVILKHLDEEKITWYKCEQCQYKARLKASLKRHIQSTHSGNDLNVTHLKKKTLINGINLKSVHLKLKIVSSTKISGMNVNIVHSKPRGVGISKGM